MKNRVVNYKNYVISTEEGTEKGIFFRCPLQNVSFDGYVEDPLFSMWKYLEAIKNPVRRFYEILIGNGEIVKNLAEWVEDYDFAGFSANIICFPIYFKRGYRKLHAISCDDDNIKEITSYGYESEFETCSGYCAMEKTIIRLKNGKKIKIKRGEQYHFTYEYIVKEILDKGKI